MVYCTLSLRIISSIYINHFETPTHLYFVGHNRTFLTQKMKEARRGFTGEDFRIRKDENNNVTISLTYYDEVRVFGVILKELEFTLKKTMSEVEATY